MADNAVNNVVANLIRAAAGSSAKSISDQDVDKYVADLILKEAEEKRKKYKQVGVQAYQPSGLPSKPKPKPNTRFLLNMVKATDSHNQAVIKANEDNVAKLREERLERERLAKEENKEREARRRHRYDDDRRSSDKSSSRRDDRRRSHRDDKSSRDNKSDNQDRKKRHRGNSVSSMDSADRIHIERLKRRASRSPSPPKKQDVQYKGRGKVRINVSSMDKYFSKGYDPALDIDSDEEEYVFAEEKDSKKHKHKKHSESRKKKHKKSSKKKKHYTSSSSSSDDDDKVAPPKPVRAWDLGKV